MEHIEEVRARMRRAIDSLSQRAAEHDQSKMQPPEVAAFDEMTPMLKTLTYGTPEYKESLVKLGPALQHHYSVNSHHPEFHDQGIKGMSLLDLVEMVCDWSAASIRTENADLRRSLEINQERFGYGDELKQIMLNTMVELGLVK